MYDGTGYTKWSEFFDNKFNVSFVANYDGAPKFKSTSMQLWPVQLYLNELPPSVRYVENCSVVALLNSCFLYYRLYSGSRENLFMAGIWCATRKPPTESFLKPISDCLNQLATEGDDTVCMKFECFVSLPVDSFFQDSK